jgi:hypothetical protein
MDAPVPVLGTQNFIFDPYAKFDQILSDFFLTDARQDQVFQDNIISFPKLCQLAGKDYQTLATSVKREFDTLLSRYFSTYQIAVKISTNPLPNKENELTLHLTVTINSDGSKVSGNYSIRTADAQLQEIIKKINNAE